MNYLMDSPREAARIRAKTSGVLIRHQLDWAELRAAESFVDFGCASGEVLREVAPIAAPAEVVGIDASNDMLDCARRESDRQGFDNVVYRRAEIAEVGSSGLPGNRYDHAWSRFLLEYHSQPIAAISEMVRVVRPGGRVTLIDIEGNCVWHSPLPAALASELDEVVADLREVGFDPHAGRHLRHHAKLAGLEHVRETIEPYHYVVGAPGPATAAAWRLKIETLRDNYVGVLFPDKASKAAVFDEFLDFLMDEDSMTWSLLHLVQGVKPDQAMRGARS
jgi:ubiquinone/menaquinone biosynthesis C-methylase UbiE